MAPYRFSRKDADVSATTLPGQAKPIRFGAGSRLRSLVLGRAEDPSWAMPALIGLLLVTAVAYLWNLTASGDANSFYAAAVQAATRSWKALFFGSIDSSNFITVDKPPASLWVMALSGRLFGFSSASMLVPQVLEGVVAVGLLTAGVKRWFGPGAGLLAGGLLAATPVAALMFRFNNPDALLVCLLVASAYCLVRALERGSARWMIAVGTAAATSGSQSAASLELATGGVPVMAIGGFNGQGGNLSLAQFEAYVKAGDIHYYIVSGGTGGGTGNTSLTEPVSAPAATGKSGRPPGGGMPGGQRGTGGGPGGASTSSAITSWVKAHYRAETIGGRTVYDLTHATE